MSSDELQVAHVPSPDGLTLTSVGRVAPDGPVYKSAVTWTDLATATAHYEDAERIFEERLLHQIRVAAGERRTGRKIRTPLGTLFVYTSIGPPTWWLPNVGVRLKDRPVRVRAGWLRAAFEVTWQPGQ